MRLNCLKLWTMPLAKDALCIKLAQKHQVAVAKDMTSINHIIIGNGRSLEKEPKRGLGSHRLCKCKVS